MADNIRAISPSGVDLALDVAGSGVLPELVQLTGDADRVVTVADVLGAGQTFPLAEVAEAHRVGEEGTVRGKLVLLLT